MSQQLSEFIIEPDKSRVVLSRSLPLGLTLTCIELARTMPRYLASGASNIGEVTGVAIVVFVGTTLLGALISLMQFETIRHHLRLVATATTLVGPSPKWSWNARVVLLPGEHGKLTWERDWWDLFCTRRRIVDGRRNSIAIMDFVYRPSDLGQLRAWCAAGHEQQGAA